MTIVTIIASGTRGDVQPAIALGRALSASGYRVRVLAGSSFGSWIESHGLEAAPSRVDMQAVMASDAGRAWVAQGHRQLAQQRLMRRLVDEHAATMIDDAWAAAAGTDLLVSGFTSDAYALTIGERLGVPAVSLALQPALVATADGRAMAAAPFPGRVSRVNRWFGSRFFEPFAWSTYGEHVNRFRRDIGLAAQSAGAYAEARRRMTTLHAVSRHVLPHPADWPPGFHITGYLFLDEPAGPPPELVRFLDDGPPPVAIGFGSMTGGDPAGTGRLVLEAVRRAGVRAVLLAGWGGMAAGAEGRDVAIVDHVAHAWLFPRVTAVVQHGGAGTVAAALRAGVPSVVVPHMADQPYWGRRIHELGAGPRPLPRHRLTAESLATAIEVAVGDAGMRARAAELAAGIAREDGPGEAVRIIRGIVAP